MTVAYAYIGADPGAMGAIALLHGSEAHVWDAPMRLVKRGSGKKPISDLPALRSLFASLFDMYPIRCGAVEKVWGVRGQAANTGAALAHARCALECAFVWNGLEPELVAPQRWQADLGLFKLPDEMTVALALRLFPAHPALTTRRKTKTEIGVTKEMVLGRAEALLITHWLRCKHEGRPWLS